MSKRPDYGLDAPAWLFGTAIAGAGALAVGAYARVAPGVALSGVLRHAIWPGLIWMGYAALHLWSSKFGKRLYVRRLLDEMAWRGDEQVLDVGCGHGLLLIEAARRVHNGRAIGVDVWSSKDQWGNRPEATLSNAHRAGVADRVEVRDADARELPFPDGAFDVAVSSFVIHNIKDKDQQVRAVLEMVRVLRPGGRLLIMDIEGTNRYRTELQRAGMLDVHRRRTPPLFVPGTATVTARKP